MDGGAHVEGANAVHHILDRDELDGLKLPLAHVKDFSALTSTIGNPLMWAIRRHRPRAHVDALLAAGAEPIPMPKPRTVFPHIGSHYRMDFRRSPRRWPRRGRDFRRNPTVEAQFVAACARADEAEARRIPAGRPGIFQSLSDSQLRQFPQLMEGRATHAVKVMVKLGWPIAVNNDPEPGNCIGCAQALVEHGMPTDLPGNYSGEVADFFAAVRQTRTSLT